MAWNSTGHKEARPRFNLHRSGLLTPDLKGQYTLKQAMRKTGYPERYVRYLWETGYELRRKVDIHGQECRVQGREDVLSLLPPEQRRQLEQHPKLRKGVGNV